MNPSERAGGHDEAHHHGHAPHEHGHGPHPARARRRSDRTRLWITLGFTVVIAVAEGVGGYLSNSLALLSDAGHMVTDLSALGLSLLALWFAEKPADPKRTYGYYRLEILSALANGIILVAITGYLCFEAYQRFRAPQPIRFGEMIGIAAIGLCANVGGLLFLHRGESMSVRGAFLHVLGDTLASVGVIAGGLVMYATQALWIDPVLSVVISAIILFGAYRLVRDATDVLLEGVPPHVDLEAVRTLMGAVAGVTAVHDLHVWTISSGMYALSAHLVVLDPAVCNNDQILSAVKHQLYDRFGIDHTTIQIESQTYAHLGEVH